MYTRRFVAAAVCIFACAIAARGSRAQDTPVPFAPPASWRENTTRAQQIAYWRRGDAWYSADVFWPAPSARALFDKLDHPDAIDPRRKVLARHRVTVCSIPARIETGEFKRPDGSVLSTEQLNFVVDGVAYSASYSYPKVIGADPRIEEIVHGCPADLPWAAPPAGWLGQTTGIFFLWAPQQTAPHTSLYFTARGRASDGTPPESLISYLSPSSHVTQSSSCGIPLILIRDFTDEPTNYTKLTAISQYGHRVYAAMYNRGSTTPEDEAAQTAVLNLCAKNPIPKSWFNTGASSAPATPEPTVALRLRVPKSFVATETFIDSPPGTARRTNRQIFAGEAAMESDETDAGGATTTTREIGSFQYELREGVWYRKTNSFLNVHGWYPTDSEFHGIRTRLPDATVNGVATEVYRFAEGGNEEMIWIGKVDRYVRRFDARYTGPDLPKGTTEYETMTLTQLDKPLDVSVPTHYVDVSACASNDKPVQAVNVAEPQMPAHPKEHLTKSVTVAVRVTVGTDGGLLETEVLRSSGYPDIDAQALVAARQTTYKPRISECRPVQSTGTVDFEFDPAPSS